MKKYFTDIIKPKWYIIVLGIVLFIAQCMAAINLCYQLGGGYYVIIPVQVIAGYLNVMMFLMVQKDKGSRGFWAFALISVILGAISALLIFDNVYSSVPGAKGIFYGALAQYTLAAAFYAALGVVRALISYLKPKKSAEGSK
jgi:uncharacterized membrane protein HdeD (DUF308 family)